MTARVILGCALALMLASNNVLTLLITSAIVAVLYALIARA